ncbi:hypothetical protein FPV67DRAFT_1668654 [Lyophyllum atratum]|nr:hypothetical protein FPV67DRAFT_1668654 [Lyophyllum atratum]
MSRQTPVCQQCGHLHCFLPPPRSPAPSPSPQKALKSLRCYLTDSVSSTSVNTIRLCSAPGSKANGKCEGQETRRQTPAGGELLRPSGACEPELSRSQAPTSPYPQPSPPPLHCGRSQPIAVMRAYFWAFPGFLSPPLVPTPSDCGALGTEGYWGGSQPPPQTPLSVRRVAPSHSTVGVTAGKCCTDLQSSPSPVYLGSPSVHATSRTAHPGKWVVGLLDAPTIDRSCSRYKRRPDVKPTNMASTHPNSNSPLVQHSGDDALPSPDTTDSDSEGEYSSSDSSDSDDSDTRLARFARCLFCGAKRYAHTLRDYRIRDPRLMLRVTPVGNIIHHVGGDRAVVNLYCGRDPTKFLIPFVEVINNILCSTWICSVCLQKAFIVVVPPNDEDWGVDGYRGAQKQRFVPFPLDGPQRVD